MQKYTDYEDFYKYLNIKKKDSPRITGYARHMMSNKKTNFQITE